MAEMKLTDLIDVKVLQRIQDGFSKYTGMAALTTDADGVPVTRGSGFTDFCMNLNRKSPLGSKRCKECDKNGALQTLKDGKPSVYFCHAGLMDYAAPIMVEGEFIGSFIGGQVRPPVIDEEEMRKRAVELSVDPDRYLAAAKQTHVLERTDVEKAAEFLSEIAKVLSEMAYRNYEALKESRKLERAARSQSAYIMNMSLGMQKKVKEWMQTGKQAMESHDYAVMESTMKELLYRGSEVYASVEDAIQYIRMAGDDVELMETEYNIRDLLQQMIEGLGRYLEDRDIQFALDIDKDVPETMLGDSGRIGQVINKLLQILVSFQKKGKIGIRVSGSKVSYATILEFEIKNTDLTIPDEIYREIKNYFENENDYLAETDELGGISIVELLVKQMSGTVHIESDERTGTAFRVSLPQLEIKGGGKHGL